MNVAAAAHIRDLLMQAKAEVDRMAQLQMDRSSLAFGSAMVCSPTPRWACDGAMCTRTEGDRTPIFRPDIVAQDVSSARH